VTCVSGTFALEAALAAVGVRPGDEVIMAGYDFEPSFLCVHAVGAKPVLVDVDAGNACLDVAQVAGAAGPKTRAVIASHLHGGVVPMAELMAVAAGKNLAVIEDAAQATGATVQGRPAGSWGDAGILSFGGTKLL